MCICTPAYQIVQGCAVPLPPSNTKTDVTLVCNQMPYPECSIDWTTRGNALIVMRRLDLQNERQYPALLHEDESMNANLLISILLDLRGFVAVSNVIFLNQTA